MAGKKKEIKECEVYRKADEVFSEHHIISNEYYVKTNPALVRLEDPEEREEFRKLYLERYRRYYKVIHCPKHQ